MSHTKSHALCGIFLIPIACVPPATNATTFLLLCGRGNLCSAAVPAHSAPFLLRRLVGGGCWSTTLLSVFVSRCFSAIMLFCASAGKTPCWCDPMARVKAASSFTKLPFARHYHAAICCLPDGLQPAGSYVLLLWLSLLLPFSQTLTLHHLLLSPSRQ